VISWSMDKSTLTSWRLTAGNEVNQEQLQTEWKLLKYDLLAWKLPQSVKDGKLSCAEWVMQQLVKQKFTYQAHFPLMITVVEALLVIPVSNTWHERSASKVKLIKNRLRSLLKGDMLNSLLHISLNGPRVTLDDGKQVIKVSVVSWLAEKNRKKLPPVDAVAGRTGWKKWHFLACNKQSWLNTALTHRVPKLWMKCLMRKLKLMKKFLLQLKSLAFLTMEQIIMSQKNPITTVTLKKATSFIEGSLLNPHSLRFSFVDDHIIFKYQSKV